MSCHTMGLNAIPNVNHIFGSIQNLPRLTISLVIYPMGGGKTAFMNQTVGEAVYLVSGAAAGQKWVYMPIPRGPTDLRMAVLPWSCTSLPSGGNSAGRAGQGVGGGEGGAVNDPLPPPPVAMRIGDHGKRIPRSGSICCTSQLDAGSVDEVRPLPSPMPYTCHGASHRKTNRPHPASPSPTCVGGAPPPGGSGTLGSLPDRRGRPGQPRGGDHVARTRLHEEVQREDRADGPQGLPGA